MNNVLERALKNARVLVCVGPGGVGKTTVAAALALGNALKKNPSLVCTIDPAKRLANALGLKTLGNSETRIPPAQLAAAALPEDAPLSATMLDMKQSWDELMARILPKAAREKVYANRYYQSLSSTLAGSQEYIAMERVARFRDQHAYSLIVLDTPPASHALDFLDAPKKVRDVFGNDSLKWLFTPALAAGKLGLSLLNLGGSYASKMLSKFTGAETLKDLADFMLQISGATQALEERARAVEALVQEPTTQFVMVTGPNAERMEELVQFHRVFEERRLGVAAVVVNRVHLAPTEAQRKKARTLEEPLRTKMETALDEAERMAERDALGIREVRRLYPNELIVLLPRLPKDVHDLKGLHTMAQYLLGEGQLPT